MWAQPMKERETALTDRRAPNISFLAANPDKPAQYESDSFSFVRAVVWKKNGLKKGLEVQSLL